VFDDAAAKRVSGVGTGNRGARGGRGLRVWGKMGRTLCKGQKRRTRLQHHHVHPISAADV
jgi:hypothetical protein